MLADHVRLLKTEAEVTECVFNDWDEQRMYDTGVPYRSLEVSGGGDILSRVKNFLLRVKRFRQLKRALRPEITISHLEGADYISLLSGGKDKKIIVIHGSKTGDQNITGMTGRLRHGLLMPWLYGRADRIITVSKAIREEMIRHYDIRPERIISLPNFFDCDAIEQRAAGDIDASLLPLFSRSSFKLITFARLAAQKNLAVLFPLLKALKARAIPVQLYIIGDGELRVTLLEAARAVGSVWSAWNDTPADAAHDIFFVGYQSNPHAFLKHADLYLMTSLWEGFPMALCEAMASGIAVAAADCPTGPSEILGDTEKPGYGLQSAGALMPVIKDVQDGAAIDYWAEVIAMLSADADRLRSIRDRGRERVRYYDRANVGPKWKQAYLGILA